MFPESYSKFPLVIYFTHDSVYASMLLSPLVPPPPSSLLLVSLSLFAMYASPCCLVNRFISTISRFHQSVQFSCSVVSDSATPWTAAHWASLSITNSQSVLKLMSIQSVMPSNHLILCLPLLLPPSVFPSIRIFSNESVFRIRWPKD